ncbi:MAG: hypothetical protein H0W53_18330 [Acidobacteria bacterium]|nr:hypothetical protein [Acidobacteriota bacterium]
MGSALGRQVVAVAATGLLFGVAGAAARQHGDDTQLLSKLSASRHTIVDGIRQAEKADGPAISAKFEMKGGQLMLSVYTAKQGREKDAEHNTLMELIGPATDPSWKPETAGRRLLVERTRPDARAQVAGGVGAVPLTGCRGRPNLS